MLPEQKVQTNEQTQRTMQQIHIWHPCTRRTEKNVVGGRPTILHGPNHTMHPVCSQHYHPLNLSYLHQHRHGGGPGGGEGGRYEGGERVEGRGGGHWQARWGEAARLCPRVPCLSLPASLTPCLHLPGGWAHFIWSETAFLLSRKSTNLLKGWPVTIDQPHFHSHPRLAILSVAAAGEVCLADVHFVSPNITGGLIWLNRTVLKNIY